jgi:thioredoxin:protein disulfide reductase
MIRKRLVFITMLFLMLNTSFASVTSYLTIDNVNPKSGEIITLNFEMEMDEGFHIYSTNFDMPFPTEIIFKDSVAFDRLGKIIEPKPHVKFDKNFEQNVESYEGQMSFIQKMHIRENLKSGEYVISGSISYLSCNEATCIPHDDEFSQTINISNGYVESDLTELDTSEQTVDSQTSNIESELTKEEEQARAILDKGILMSILIFFGFGIALNLTPCVYPVIPITISFFGSQSEKNKGSMFLLAIFYTLGIAFIFALLGLISSIAGQQWGFLFQSTWFVIIIVMIMLIFSASMFGVFEISIPASFMSKVGASREGVIGALIMGLTVGFVIAPCAAGIIVGLIGIVAREGMVFKGTLLFFVMGLGLGLPYLILGTFSGLLNKLPSSGMWMVWIKKVFGIILIGVAIYFLLPQISMMVDKQIFTLGVLTIFAGIYLGFLDRSLGYTKSFIRIIKSIGIILIVVGFIMTNNGINSKASEIKWIKYHGESIEQIRVDEKPLIFDFYTDFCAPCKKMNKTTFKDERVLILSEEFTMVKIDMTNPDEAMNKFASKYNVTGFPTIIFIDKNGNEIYELSTRGGYVGPEDFYNSMKTIK